MSSGPPAGLAFPGRDWAYFFDIDGTLAEIADFPAAASVDPELRASIAALSGAVGGALALVSGRSIAAVDALFPGTRMPIAGQHGAERRTAGGTVELRGPPAETVGRLRASLHAAQRAHPGLFVEDKGVALALHYRNAPHLAALAHRLARALAAECGAAVTVQSGKMVVELLPAGEDKGRAVLAFMAEPPFRGRRPIFVGDDRTDEAAFTAVNDLGGCSVKVGPGRTAARWRLRHVADVKAWLSSALVARPVRRAPTLSLVR